MRRSILPSFIALAALAACTETPQTMDTSRGPAHDTAAWQGPAKVTAYTAPGWKPGEKTSWEQGLKTRTVNGQNEYVRVP